LPIWCSWQLKTETDSLRTRWAKIPALSTPRHARFFEVM